ncbi:hypothetical protein DFH09DRAFT_1105667 [Mycena vulgaris]|nr:hypothetical protein DFH09DRAFT_1105667 [Mycena vulgaris]
MGARKKIKTSTLPGATGGSRAAASRHRTANFAKPAGEAQYSRSEKQRDQVRRLYDWATGKGFGAITVGGTSPSRRFGVVDAGGARGKSEHLCDVQTDTNETQLRFAAEGVKAAVKLESYQISKSTWRSNMEISERFGAITLGGIESETPSTLMYLDTESAHVRDWNQSHTYNDPDPTASQTEVTSSRVDEGRSQDEAEIEISGNKAKQTLHMPSVNSGACL